MTIIECTEEKYALNLNPYQIFIFINEKTKPYLEQFKQLQENCKSYEIVLLPFESSEVRYNVDDSVDPQLYNVISSSDVVARIMPKKYGDYLYMTETFHKGKNYDFDYMNSKINDFMFRHKIKKRQSYVNTIRRFFQYGNQEFSDFIMDVFKGDLKDLQNMSERYTHMVCSKDYAVAERFTRAFIYKLDDPQKELLDTIVKDTLDYNSPKESKAVFSDFIYSAFEQQGSNAQGTFSCKKNPDFNLVVSISNKKKLADAEGDYDINVVKDNGETIPLKFGYRGDKMFYLLTLLCQKEVGGLPSKFFKFDSSKTAIMKLYDEVFRFGGDVWVDAMAKDSHKLSVCRTHAKSAIENSNFLDLKTSYWCNLDTTTLKVGPKKKQLKVRRVRLPKERIVINDDGQLTQHLEKLPSLEQIVGYTTPNSAKVMGIQVPRIRLGYNDTIEELNE